MNKKLLLDSKLLLITKNMASYPVGGREMLSKINYNVLSKILGNKLILFELKPQKIIKFWDILNSLRGYIDGITKQTIQEAIVLIKRENIRHVFVDGSNLGGFVSELKRNIPEVEIITFFHNVEASFFWGALNSSKSLRAVAILIVNYLAERKATQLSDKRICLSRRDAQLLQSLYGKGATHIAPMVLSDQLTNRIYELQIDETEQFALFVGGNFYANREGIAWFAKYVARRIPLKVCVVGKGMEKIRSEIEIPGKVEVIGPVEDLADWYRRARFVIAPIFGGSGMKTKVAEALMHGKKVVGTPEAFSGYEETLGIGWVCRTADDFVTAINEAQQEICVSFDPKLRNIYLQNYSFEAAKNRLEKILL